MNQRADDGAIVADDHPMHLRRHPSFVPVFVGFCDQLIAPLRGQRLMIKLFGQRAPTEIAAHIVMMHLSARKPVERPTLTRLQARLPGPRQTAAFVAVLRGLSLVNVERDPADARIRYLVPGPVILDGLRGWLAVHLDCHARLTQIDELSSRLQSDAGFYAETIRQCATWLDRANRPLTAFSDLAWTDEHDSGIHLALTLVARSAGGREAIAMSTAELASSLGVSRSHIRNLLAAMEARGLVRFDDGRRRLSLAPGFVASVEAWFCHQVCWLAAAAARADRALRRPLELRQIIVTRPEPMS
ncbi:helix-turn-helix domain-containing protein [Bradyrhizobium oligotrophicum]|uniref:helix-turn-helix domain-containing protein n=1 Tax=Bradyrhizobium oligotrophicum TaxID=44255 RepID=UPI003EBAB3ED